MKRLIFPILLIFFLLYSLKVEAKIYLDVYGKSLKKITIAVPYFKSDKISRLRMDMAELLNKDLDLSGFFIPAPQTLMDRELLDEGIEKREIRFGNWRSLGVELLCKGFLQEKDDDLILDVYVYDTLDGTLVHANKYRGKTDGWRRLIHKLADDIILAVTGDKGIMSSRIVFVSGYRGKKEIYVADFDGHNIKRLTNYNSITLSPSVSPTGKYLAYTSYEKGRPNLYILDLEKKIEAFVDSDSGMKTGTSWKNKDTFSYSFTSGKSSTIYTVDVGSKTKKPILSGDGIYTSPSFSPDGTKMVFVSDMHGTPQIFLKDLNSGEIKRLTFSGDYNVAPTFSPKGDLIAFISKIEGSFEICTMNPDGSNPRLLTNGGLNDSPHFSPCGRYIIFSTMKGNRYNISIMLFNGDNKRLLKFTEGDETQPVFMP
ncbi:MAG: hypothetical protein N3D15_04050 [Syntrophorhabdaceae bacterium]|nr:hypothetical protein [Syntrophorhabdaceae bacterium]